MLLILNLVNKIKFALSNKVPFIECKKNRFLVSILQNLKQHNYITSFEEFDRTVRIGLSKNLFDVGMISKPSRKVYCKRDEFPKFYNSMAGVVVTTSGGVMLSSEAEKKKLGGIPLFYII